MGSSSQLRGMGIEGKKLNFFMSSDYHSHCEGSNYGGTNCVLKPDSLDWAAVPMICSMVLPRQCYFTFLNGTRKFQVPLDTFIRKGKKKKKERSLPQYERPLPRQTHQEVGKERRSTRLHNAGTHGQSYTHPLQFLQRLKNKSAHIMFFQRVDDMTSGAFSDHAWSSWFLS